MNSTSAPFKLVIGLRKENINVEREVGIRGNVQEENKLRNLFLPLKRLSGEHSTSSCLIIHQKMVIIIVYQGGKIRRPFQPL